MSGKSSCDARERCEVVGTVQGSRVDRTHACTLCAFCAFFLRVTLARARTRARVYTGELGKRRKSRRLLSGTAHLVGVEQGESVEHPHAWPDFDAFDAVLLELVAEGVSADGR